MKMLHTSDWHVGKAIRGESRADEHRAVLGEIVGIAESEQVDLVIVAGDLFDSASPTAEAEEIVYRALLGLAGAGIPVAVIAGNHDNAKRLQAVAPLLELGKVVLVAEPTRPEAGGVIELTTADGTEVRLAMLPFVSKRGIVRAEQLMDHAAFEHAQVYAERLRLLVDHMCRGFTDDTVNILAAHAFVLGAAAGGGERAAHLVEEYAITAQSFPASIGYGALGHLHRPQRIPAGPPLHYCGSPLQLDFGEGDGGQAKQVNIVTIEPGVPADVRAVPLASGRRLRTVRGGLDDLLSMEVPPDTWLRVIVQGATRAGLAQRVRDVLGTGVVDVRVEDAGRSRADGNADHQNRSPYELFDAYLQREGVADDRIRGLFAELLDLEIEGTDR
jgi:DNA repair protein SbcD/Mre11